jgi:hypothetical protein
MSSFPVTIKTWVTPNKVSIVLHIYTNRLFVLISEVSAGSTGTIVEFQQDILTKLELPLVGDYFGEDAPDKVYDIRVLFGVEKPEILLAARVIGSRIHDLCAIDIPILFGFGLKRFEKPLIEEIAKSLIDNLPKNNQN